MVRNSGVGRFERRCASAMTWLVLAIALQAGPGHAVDAARAGGAYSLEIRKSERILQVKSGATVVRSFAMAGGRGGRGDKRLAGDNRTPVGVYRIADFNEESRFHFFMHLNYPNVEDAFWGYKNGIISERDFDRILRALRAGDLPPQNTPLGGSIGIHGLATVTPEMLKIHKGIDWTEGCVALTNEEIEELRGFVVRGTRVVIVE